jgi:hypothetical protein
MSYGEYRSLPDAGVLDIDAPPVQPTVEQAMFLSALAGLAEFRRTQPEPASGGPGYERWYSEHGERITGIDRVAQRILSDTASPLDALAAVAVHYVLDEKPELIARATLGEEYERYDIATWIVARLLSALQPSLSSFPTEFQS